MNATSTTELALVQAASRAAELVGRTGEARVLATDEWRRLGGVDGNAWTVRVEGAVDGSVDLVLPADGSAAAEQGSEALLQAVQALALLVGPLAPESVRPVTVASVVSPAIVRPQVVVGVVADGALGLGIVLTDEAAGSSRATDAPQAGGQAPATFRQLPVTGPAPDVDPRRLHLLRDVEMGISVELGRTRMSIQEVLGLAPGSVLELDRAAGSPVDVFVNGTLLARGEVVVVDDEYAVRVTEVVGPELDGRRVG